MITTDVENYPGFEKPILGPTLMQEMKKQAENVGAKIILANASECTLTQQPFSIKDDRNNTYIAKSIIIATGALAKWLGIPGEKKLQGAGVSACATCDGAFFKNQRVAVIGGGNTAVEEALFLTRHAEKVFLIHRRKKLRAEKILQNKLFNNKKIKVLWDSIVVEMIGNTDSKNEMPELVALKIKTNGSEKILKVEGAFVAIGHIPETSMFTGKINMDKDGYIITKENSTKTNVEGVFAAGDVKDKIFRQAITAAGFGCMAAIEAQAFLE